MKKRTWQVVGFVMGKRRPSCAYSYIYKRIRGIYDAEVARLRKNIKSNYQWEVFLEPLNEGRNV